MDLLLLILLLCSYLHPNGLVSAQEGFSLDDVSLWVEPSTNVPRDTNVTLRCKAKVSSSGQAALTREYTIYKGDSIIYTKTSVSSDDLLYLLPQARFSNSGKYQCTVKIKDTLRKSEVKKLTVTGLSTPVLRVDKDVVTEGEEITAWCSAPGETGSITFYFYNNSTDVVERRKNSNQVEVKVPLSSVGLHQIHCTYTVMLETYRQQDSEVSNSLTVSVKELSFRPVLVVAPDQQVFEGDPLTLECTVSGLQGSSGSPHLSLSQGTRFLGNGTSSVKRSMTALVQELDEFRCSLEMGNVFKVVTKRVPVIELFSAPTLSMAPSEVFQAELMTLTCRSESFASERLSRDELIYSLLPPDHHLQRRDNGVFFGKALAHDFNYTCEARAKGLVKVSPVLTVRPKVPVSVPRISVKGRAILGRPVQILCQSDSGSLPINYTLLRSNKPVDTVSVQLPSEEALFRVSVGSTAELSKLTCEARNNPSNAPHSSELEATVVEPLSIATLTVIPNPGYIYEEDELLLICGVKGSPPITFKWFRSGQEEPLHTTIANNNHTDFQIPQLSKGHSDRYHCEAVNNANHIRSQPVDIYVHMAHWKQVLIGVGVPVGVLMIIFLVACVWCIRSNRGRREPLAGLTVKPSSPKSDDSIRVNLSSDTEVYNTATGAALLYDGSEGRATNGVRASAASLPADISNRSSYSNPATV